MRAEGQAAEIVAEIRRIEALADEEDARFFNVMPKREWVPTYKLIERTADIKQRNFWYMYKIPESRSDPEITLQLFQRDESTGHMNLLGNVGDLYQISLMIPNGPGEVPIHLLVESAESRRSPYSLMYYSVFDAGHLEKAYSCPAEAWETYMMFRGDGEEDRRELDTRLWYLLLGDKEELKELCTLEHFRTIRSKDELEAISNRMLPGLLIERPTSSQALLSMNTGHVVELLRSDDLEERDGKGKEKIKLNLDERFRTLDINKTSRVTRSQCRQPSVDLEEMPELEASPEDKYERRRFGLPWEVERDVKSFLARCFSQEQAREDKEYDDAIWKQVYEAEALLHPELVGVEGSPSSEGRSPRAELSFMGEEHRDSFNRSEYEAAVSYRYRFYVDDIDVVVEPEVEGDQGPHGNEEGEGVLQAQIETSDPVIIPGNEEMEEEQEGEEENESQEMASEPSFIFNDSLDVYLAKPVNESQIFTIESSEDSVTMDGSWDEGANAGMADELNIAQVNMPDVEEEVDQNLDL